MLVETTSEPDGSSQAVHTWGSRYAWYTHGVRNVASTTASLAANAASTSPSSRVMRSRTFSESSSAASSSWPRVDAGVDRLEVACLVVARLDHARERRAGLHRGLDVDDRGERLVLDDDRLGAVLRGGLRLRDHERDWLPGEDDLLARERLRRAVGAGRRDRKVGGGQDRDDAGDLEGAGAVDVDDAGVRLGREHEARVQEPVDVAVRRVARRARDLVGRVASRARDADDRVAHRSSCARSRALSSARRARTAASSRRYSADAKRSP